MRKIRFIIVTLLLFIVWTVKAGEQLSDTCKRILITDVKVMKTSDKVIVEFDIEPEKKIIGTNYKMTLTPYLFMGSDTLWLDSKIIIGKNKMRREKQERLLSGNKTIPDSVEIIHQGIKSHYTIEVHYLQWMKVLSMSIDQYLEGCCTKRLIARQILAQNLLLKK